MLQSCDPKNRGYVDSPGSEVAMLKLHKIRLPKKNNLHNILLHLWLYGSTMSVPSTFVASRYKPYTYAYGNAIFLPIEGLHRECEFVTI